MALAVSEGGQKRQNHGHPHGLLCIKDEMRRQRPYMYVYCTSGAPVARGFGRLQVPPIYKERTAYTTGLAGPKGLGDRNKNQVKESVLFGTVTEFGTTVARCIAPHSLRRS